MTRVVTSTDVSSFTTDAKFRTWGSTISGALAACGLVQTADTGQINWVTVTKPVATTTVAGYEIWRFNDALQSTAPIYIKVQYGSGGTTSGNSPQIWWSVSSGTDGAGNLNPGSWFTVGGAVTAGSYSPNHTVNNTAQVGYFTHSDGYLFAFTSSNAISAGASPGCNTLLIERTRNQTTGVVTDEGVYIVVNGGAYANTSGIALTTYHVNLDTQFTYGSNGVFAPPGNAGITSVGAYVFPCYSWMPGLRLQAGCVGLLTSDIASASTFTMKPIGNSITHTYLVIDQFTACTTLGTGSTSATRLAVMWED